MWEEKRKNEDFPKKEFYRGVEGASLVEQSRVEFAGGF